MRSRRVLVVVSAAIFLALAAAAPQLSAAGRPAFVYDRDLSWWIHQSLELASELTGSETKQIPLPVYVRCYSSDTAFDTAYSRDGGSEPGSVIAYYDPGTPYISLRALTCGEVHLFTDRFRVTETTAGAVATLLHEALHRQGFANEKLTECYGDTSAKYAGWLAWWQTAPDGVPWGQGEHWGDRAEALALQDTWHSVAESYRMSKSTCKALTKRRSWADTLGLT